MGFTASNSTPNTDIDDTSVTLPAGSTITYTVTGSVNLGATGVLSNNAFINPSSPSFIKATDNDNLADLEIIKSDDLGDDGIRFVSGTSGLQSLTNSPPGTEGQFEKAIPTPPAPPPEATYPMHYTIVVSNAGPGFVDGATITDPAWPTPTFEETSWVATETGFASGFTASNSTPGTTIDDTHVNLPSGSSIKYVVTGLITSMGSETISNTATVTPPVGASVSATDTDGPVEPEVVIFNNGDFTRKFGGRRPSDHSGGEPFEHA